MKKQYIMKRMFKGNIFHRMMKRYAPAHVKYKDRLFRFLFQEKEDLLALYNAVNGTHYTNEEELEINTLEDVIYLSMKNDLSFIFCWRMNLYEHQSSVNPNMPIRGLMYFARIYENYIQQNGLNIYGSTGICLPVPQFIVFYNGSREQPDETELKLSDLFSQDKDGTAGEIKSREHVKPALECTARMLNINQGHNEVIVSGCRRLKEYSFFVARVEYYQKQGHPLEDAVDAASDECLKEGILADVLEKSRNEVKGMLLTEYDEELQLRRTYEDGEKIGLARGLAKGEKIGLARGEQIGIAKGEKIGITKGEQIGITRGKAELLLKALARMGDVPDELKDKIQSVNEPGILDQWFGYVMESKTIGEFMEKINQNLL